MNIGKIGKKSYLVPTLPYLLPPTSYYQDAGECFQALYRKYVDASKIVQPRGTYLYIHFKCLVYLGDSTSTDTYFQQAISLYYHLLIYRAEDCVSYRYLIDRYHYVYRCLGYGQESAV